MYAQVIVVQVDEASLVGCILHAEKLAQNFDLKESTAFVHGARILNESIFIFNTSLKKLGKR